MNLQAKYLGRRSLISKAIGRTHRQTHTRRTDWFNRTTKATGKDLHACTVQCREIPLLQYKRRNNWD